MMCLSRAWAMERFAVFFNNLQVIHSRGALLEETHYYPFGLTMAGISTKAAGKMENRYKYNAGTELNTDFAINLYETNFRGLDPQTGRFWQVDPLSELAYVNSPYTFVSNNPILINDPTGLQDSLYTTETSTSDKPKILDQVMVTSNKKSTESDNWQSALTALGWGAMGADFYKEMLYKGDWMYKNSKGVVQSIFNTKWGRNKTPESLGNILNYSKNARAGIRATKVVKVLKVAGKIIIVISLASDIKDVYNACKNDSPDAPATYGKVATNTTMTAVGFIPGVGWALSGIYFTIDATVGWENAIPSYIETEKVKSNMREHRIINFNDFKN